ncbi:MAG: acetyl-CoA C-acetyltransferase [Gammaproteobacteria bacterium]|nr:acetyl-CoA C-acetyltransferase [Gammaproteobacteria bacterium]
MSKRSRTRFVYVVDGSRTPFLKARGEPGPLKASDLAVQAGTALLQRQSFLPSSLGEVILGCVLPAPEEANIARIVGLRLGTGKAVPAWTVQRNCASGLQALDNAAQDIGMGRHDLVLAGGVDVMSHAPLLWNEGFVRWLAKLSRAKDIGSKLKSFTQFQLKFLVPSIALLKGLTDPVSGLSMGQTAEELAHRFQISRKEMDTFAEASHKKVLAAEKAGHFVEVEPVYDISGHCYSRDDGVREDSTVEKLGKLTPFFDRPFGQVTAGNSSQVTDGAALLILASDEAVKKHQLPVLGRLVDFEWAGCEPTQMGLGPVHAITPLLLRNRLSLSNVDYWEINEAFAAQVLACVKAWESEEYCTKELGLKGIFGQLPLERLNVDGGAIAIGHPIGASGARLTLRLLHILKRHQARFGVASLCIGGGQGGAVLVENVSGVENE